MPKGYKHLPKRERWTLDIMEKKGDSLPKIAKYLGRPVSTLSREQFAWLSLSASARAERAALADETSFRYSDEGVKSSRFVWLAGWVESRAALRTLATSSRG